MPQPLFRTVDCVLLSVSDLAAGRRFYVETLGHTVIWQTDDAVGLRLRESSVELVLSATVTAQETDLLVDSAEQTAREFQLAGGSVVAGPMDIAIGKCVVLRDPWGNTLVAIDNHKGQYVRAANGAYTVQSKSPEAKVELVGFSEEYFEELWRWRGQAKTIRHNPLQPISKADLLTATRQESSDLSLIHKCDRFRWWVRYENKIVGSVSLKSINHMMGHGEIGYGLDDTYHGRGIGTAAVRALVTRVFTETELRKILAYVHDKNAPSLRLLAKVGFVWEGLLRQHYIIQGVPENEVLLGMLRSDWKGQIR